MQNILSRIVAKRERSPGLTQMEEHMTTSVSKLQLLSGQIVVLILRKVA